MMKLVISEKADAAARIAVILSRGDKKSTRMNGVQVFQFEIGDDRWSVVGLRGHVIELDYPHHMNSWEKTPPRELVRAAPEKRITAHNIINVLKELAKDADEIIIATDYDREGELIGLETVELLDVDMAKVTRARFSAFTRQEIDQAFSNLTRPDEKLAEAAACRQIIDLAWGATLTRFISLASGQVGSNFLSVGRVQSPTLSLIVDRDREIRTFVPKPYWNVNAKFEKDLRFDGMHQQNPFWDEEGAKSVLGLCEGSNEGKVLSYVKENKDEYPPPPFNTTMMLAEAVKIGLTASLAMKIAEDLYTAGYISYPRTDNTVYPRSLSLKNILEKLKETDFKSEAEELLEQQTIRPSRGRVETTDHPPIYPTEAASKDKLKGEKWRLYELIVRRFLATVAPSCKAEHRRATIAIKEEPFDCKGYRILSPGWRKYYPYFRVTEFELPELKEEESIKVLSVQSERRETEPLRRYSQGTLLQEMEKLGLGTKSTRHEIIQKLLDRKYVAGNDLIPTQSGIAVTNSLEKHAQTITESKMTAHLEKDMEDISNGETSLAEVVSESQDMLSDIVDVMELNKLDIGKEIRDALKEQVFMGICPACGGELHVRRSKRGEFISCTNYPKCTNAYPKPGGAKVEATGETCEACKTPTVKVIRRGNPPHKQCLNPSCEINKANTIMGVCPECGMHLRLLYSRAGKRFLGCIGYPKCTRTYPLPQLGSLRTTGEVCEACKAPIMLIINQGRPWKFCVNMDCPAKRKKLKKAEKKLSKEEHKPKKATKAKKSTTKKTPAKKKKKATSAKKPVAT
jgi:DNA topoisomerase-1